MRQTILVVNDKIKTEFKIKEKEGILREISPTISGSNPGGPTTNTPMVLLPVQGGKVKLVIKLLNVNFESLESIITDYVFYTLSSYGFLFIHT